MGRFGMWDFSVVGLGEERGGKGEREVLVG